MSGVSAYLYAFLRLGVQPIRSLMDSFPPKNHQADSGTPDPADHAKDDSASVRSGGLQGAFPWVSLLIAVGLATVLPWLAHASGRDLVIMWGSTFVAAFIVRRFNFAGYPLWGFLLFFLVFFTAGWFLSDGHGHSATWPIPWFMAWCVWLISLGLAYQWLPALRRILGSPSPNRGNSSAGRQGKAISRFNIVMIVWGAVVMAFLIIYLPIAFKVPTGVAIPLWVGGFIGMYFFYGVLILGWWLPRDPRSFPAPEHPTADGSPADGSPAVGSPIVGSSPAFSPPAVGFTGGGLPIVSPTGVLPPAGWYPDPAHPESGKQRYWTGRRWRLSHGMRVLAMVLLIIAVLMGFFAFMGAAGFALLESRNAPTNTLTPATQSVLTSIIAGTSMEGKSVNDLPDIHVWTPDEVVFSFPTQDLPALASSITKNHWYSDQTYITVDTLDLKNVSSAWGSCAPYLLQPPIDKRLECVLLVDGTRSLLQLSNEAGRTETSITVGIKQE